MTAKGYSFILFQAATGLIVGLGLFLCILSFVLADAQSQRDWDAQAREINAQNLNLALEQNLNRSFAQADAILQLVKAEIESDKKLDEPHARLLRGFLNAEIFNQIAMADSRGNLVYSAVPLKEALNIFEREAFQAHIHKDTNRMHIAAPLVNRVTGAFSIFMSRRLNDAKGEFAGIVSVGVAPDYFSKVFEQLHLGTENSFVVLKLDGTFLARIPSIAAEERLPGYRSHPLMEKLKQGEAAGVLEWQGIADGVVRIGAFRRLSNYPAVVLVGIPKNTTFADVAARHSDYRYWAGMFSVILIASFLLLWIQLRKQVQAKAALQAANENLEHKVEKRTQELQAANEDLTAQNEEITAMNQEISSLNQYLAGLNKALDQRSLQERERAEQALLENEALLKKSQEMAHVGSWDWDLRTNKLVWSEEAYRIFGVRQEEFGGTLQDFLDLVHPEDRETLMARYSGSLHENRDEYESEHRIVRKNTGEIRYVRERCEHMRNISDEIIRSVGMVQDVTMLKNIEREKIAALQKVERAGRQSMFGVLAASIAHEVNQPLSTIKVISDGLQYLHENGREILMERVIADLKEISAQTGRVEVIVKDLRSLVHSGTLSHKTEVSINELANRAIRLIAGKAEEKKVRIRAVLNPEIPLILCAPSSMLQAILNLLQNAMDAVTEAGCEQGRIIVQTGSTKQEVFVRVSDNGRGIRKDIAGQIFEPFFSTHQSGRGMGIGLAITSATVTANGGRVSYQNNRRHGASFKCVFPHIASGGES